MLKTATLISAVILTATPAFAVARHYIAPQSNELDEKSQSRPLQSQSPYTIEYKLFEGSGQNQWNQVDSGTLCYSAQETSGSDCAAWVGQRITSQPGSGGNSQQQLSFEYGIQFDPPDAQSKHGVSFTNEVSVTEGDSTGVLVPNLALASSTTTLGTWSETLFIVDANRRVRLQARLVKSR